MPKIAEIIGSEIAHRGAIPFARFMELALYCPLCGFYEAEKDRIGSRGDFYTSVSVGPLFGQLLAGQFALWLEHLRAESATETLRLVECGAHNGQLASDILDWFARNRPSLLETLEFIIVEPSNRRRQWQQERLAGLAEKVQWLPSLDEIQAHVPAGLRGVVFSNELLDAMPVHRLGWDRSLTRWFEWGVTLQNSRFTWMRQYEIVPGTGWLDPALFAERLSLPAELTSVLPDGFVVEICPAAEKWWRDAALALRSGKLLTFDYGLDTAELITPERPHGTLRAYKKHQARTDLLADPGEQDLTAHVNFDVIRRCGETAGLHTETFETQSAFLTRIAARTWNGSLPFDEWTRARRRQLQTLIHPAHLGAQFRVLVQARQAGGHLSETGR